MEILERNITYRVSCRHLVIESKKHIWRFEKVSKVVSLLDKAGGCGIGYRCTHSFLCLATFQQLFQMPMYLHTGESPKVQHAYITIAEFFGTYSLVDARRYLEKMLKTAASFHYWRDNPSNVLFLFEKLEGLTMAALTIHREGSERQDAVISLAQDEVPTLTAYRQYCGWHHKSDPWYFFPRSLSPKEYANPYSVFKQVAAKGGRKQWRFVLRELQFYTLSTSSLNESEDVALDALRLYLLFSKLLEAAHLVDVRAINEIGGEQRPKWKGLPATSGNADNANMVK